MLEKLCKPSTKAFWKAARNREGGSLIETLHGLFYLNWPEFYISVGLGRSRMAKMLRKPAWVIGRKMGLWCGDKKKSFADTYHGKAIPADELTRLIKLDRPVTITLPEKVLPYAVARDIILECHTDLVLFRCPCRATVPNPCQPLEVCILVGQPIVDFVLEHHPAKSRRISADEAVNVVIEAQKRGNVSHAFFKEAVLDRFYAICNCCACCCGAMQAYRQGTPMLASSGYVAVSDRSLCVGCGQCAKKCQFSAITMSETGPRKERRPVVNRDVCMGCGVCVMQCPQKAISLEPDPAKPEPLRI